MTRNAKPLILASASPRRSELLVRAQVPFDVKPCRLDEPRLRPAGCDPCAWAQALAYFKARAAAEALDDADVLGADTIVACNGELLGKPTDEFDARRMLESQAGCASDVITGVAIVSVRARQIVARRISAALTRVWMRDDMKLREAYLSSGDWAGKAGAYGIQNVGDALVERIEGSFSNVVGLPIELTLRMLTDRERCAPAG